jgi:hypothetical protein
MKLEMEAPQRKSNISTRVFVCNDKNELLLKSWWNFFIAIKFWN